MNVEDVVVVLMIVNFPILIYTIIIYLLYLKDVKKINSLEKKIDRIKLIIEEREI